MIGLPGAFLFVCISAFGVAASRHAWRTRQKYGLFRFLGFESLALLVAWNAHRWFNDPLGIHQLASWTIFVASLALAVHGFHLLRSVGGARRRLMEDTQSVVVVGAYRYIRHPLYASLLYIGWGVFLKGLDMLSAVLAVLATAFWYATAKCEEQFNVEQFGAAYTEYMKHTKMFVPCVI
jgi:protein-S-isoprenylcysteine O-methyltransferase Ste14